MAHDDGTLVGLPNLIEQHVLGARDDLAARGRELADRSPGAAYLARKRLDQELAIAGEVGLAELVQTAHERLAAVAAEACLTIRSQPRAQRVHLNAAYLVPEAEEEPFHLAVAELGREQADVGLLYELTGPWPAYNFVGEQVTE